MSSSPKDPFASIDPNALEKVAGGASRTSSNDQVTQMLTQISSSIKDLAGSKNSGSDPMQMMLIMMMMGGMGGGGGGVIAAPGAGHASPVINVDTAVAGGGGGCVIGGGRKRGKKGW
jgi:hypothetical protein